MARVKKSDMPNIQSMLDAVNRMTDAEWRSLSEMIAKSSGRNFDLHSLVECLRIILNGTQDDYDYDYYEASTKKSKMKKSNKLAKIPLVDVNKDDIEISFNFASTGNESLYGGRMVFYTYASFMKGYDKDRFRGGGIRDIQVGRFEYPISEALNPAIIEQMKEEGYQAVMNEIDDFIVDEDYVSDMNPTGMVANPGARFGNINGYSASTKKSKIRKENVTEIEVNGEPYFIWESFDGFKGSKENPNQRITNARAALDFNRSNGFETIDDVIDYINQYFVKSAKKSKMKKSYDFIIGPMEEYIEHLKAHGTIDISEKTIEYLENAVQELRTGGLADARESCLDALETVFEDTPDEQRIIEFIESFDKILIGNGIPPTTYGHYGSKYMSAKKSIPDTKMSFTDNVNKMRTTNYAKTGNINTVMRERK